MRGAGMPLLSYSTGSRVTRLCSSGIALSKLRRPASTCATFTLCFFATCAQAIVEFTSPTTSTRSGRSFNSTGSNAAAIFSTSNRYSPALFADIPGMTEGKHCFVYSIRAEQYEIRLVDHIPSEDELLDSFRPKKRTAVAPPAEVPLRPVLEKSGALSKNVSSFRLGAARGRRPSGGRVA